MAERTDDDCEPVGRLIDRTESEQRLLLLERAERWLGEGDPCVIVADGAERYPARLLDELRALTNYLAAGSPLFRVVLLGSRAFERSLAKPEFEAIADRLDLEHTLRPLTDEEALDYLSVQIARGDLDIPFAEEAAATIAEAAPLTPLAIDRTVRGAMAQARERFATRIETEDVLAVWFETDRRRVSDERVTVDDAIGEAVESGDVLTDEAIRGEGMNGDLADHAVTRDDAFVEGRGSDDRVGDAPEVRHASETAREPDATESMRAAEEPADTDGPVDDDALTRTDSDPAEDPERTAAETSDDVLETVADGPFPFEPLDGEVIEIGAEDDTSAGASPAEATSDDAIVEIDVPVSIEGCGDFATTELCSPVGEFPCCVADEADADGLHRVVDAFGAAETVDVLSQTVSAASDRNASDSSAADLTVPKTTAASRSLEQTLSMLDQTIEVVAEGSDQSLDELERMLAARDGSAECCSEASDEELSETVPTDETGSVPEPHDPSFGYDLIRPGSTLAADPAVAVAVAAESAVTEQTTAATTAVPVAAEQSAAAESERREAVLRRGFGRLFSRLRTGR